MHRYRRPCLLSLAIVPTSLCLLLLILAFVLPSASRAEQAAAAASQPAQPVLWRFAWVSDMHMNAQKLPYLTRAMRYIDAKLQPHFVMITGDNNYNPAPPADPKKPESLGLRRQRFFKQFLQNHLKTPYVVIPGDDWPQDFDKVFGPKQYSFNCGGIHFLLLAPDRIYHGRNLEGLSVFEKPTWDWIRRDLKRNRERPTIVVIHEPIHPPTFLDAHSLRKLLAEYPNVFAVLQGHLHVNLEYHADGKTYLVAPSLAEPPTPGMKLVEITPAGLVVRTILYNKVKNKFEMQDRLQCIEIPPALRSRLTKPRKSGFVPAEYDSLPARPVVVDPALEKRKGELLKNALLFFQPAK
ncbi:MAG: metallophosphoesterase [Phycisphaerae bacterium]|nr:metallophosphoesterase [Phycisphaerae bacterium]